jgi:CheY-like chemotaxis protein
MNYASRHVLIVDDHAFTRVLIRDVLHNLGFGLTNIHEATDGGAALQILRHRRVDLIFCDWQMEPMDGLTFMRALRNPEENENPYVPVIFCTAFAERDVIEQARDSGVNEIMTKPITAKAVEARIEKALTNPRDFVQTPDYFGPDRRRRSPTGEPFPEDRRTRAPRTASSAKT